jgi:hypothetical protein
VVAHPASTSLDGETKGAFPRESIRERPESRRNEKEISSSSEREFLTSGIVVFGSNIRNGREEISFSIRRELWGKRNAVLCADARFYRKKLYFPLELQFRLKKNCALIRT